MYRSFLIFCILLILFVPSLWIQATPQDDGQYSVRYPLDPVTGLYTLDLSLDHPNEIARLGTPAELAQQFPCVHQAVNHFLFLFGRMHNVALGQLPAPSTGC